MLFQRLRVNLGRGLAGGFAASAKHPIALPAAS